MVLKIVKLQENAILPQKGTEGSAGYDLYTCIKEKYELAPRACVLLPTGISMELPQNTAGLIYTRSGLGIKYGIHLTNGVGVIDSDYRGEVKVGLHNLSDVSYTINPGDRVAQLIVTPYFSPEIMEVSTLNESERGEGGFGSTGKS